MVPAFKLVKLAYKVVLVDLVLAYGLLSALQDLSWRVNYAGTPHANVQGYAASYSYSVLTRLFTMTGSGVTLTSPPTLDWVQLILVLMAVLNAWFAYSLIRERRPPPALAPSPAAAAP